MTEDDPHEERLWEVGWEGHTRAQRRRMAALPLAEKIRWLEQAQKLVEQMRRGRNKGKEDGGGGE